VYPLNNIMAPSLHVFMWSIFYSNWNKEDKLNNSFKRVLKYIYIYI
jgi:hypothetical protein